jgi:hypothetical protein
MTELVIKAFCIKFSVLKSKIYTDKKIGAVGRINIRKIFFGF